VLAFLPVLAGVLVQRFGLSGAFRVSVLSMAAAIGLLAAAPGVLLLAYSSAALFGSSYIMLTGIILVWSVWVFHERPTTAKSRARRIGAPLAPCSAGKEVSNDGVGWISGNVLL
jgi:hypothetical protein